MAESGIIIVTGSNGRIGAAVMRRLAGRFEQFGGIKHSGFGRELAGAGIQEFVNKKLVQVADIHAPA